MANNYTKAAFTLSVTAAEAALLTRAQAAADLLRHEMPEGDARRTAFADLGEAFGAAFPATDDDAFASFLELFADADYPSLDCDIVADPPDAAGQVDVYFGGEQVSLDTLAQLIRRTCPSALPCGFEYSFDCDRLSPGEFGGGYVVITADRIRYRGTRDGLDRALAHEQDEGADGFVLTTRHRDHGLSFWNNETGFGRLRDATVFTEAEAAKFDGPIADDEPEWLAMPPSLG